MANRSRCTAFTPCSAISPRSPAMSSASGAIASPPSLPPPPHTAPRPRSAWRNADRVDRPTPTTAYYLNALRSKQGKVRFRGILALIYFPNLCGYPGARRKNLVGVFLSASKPEMRGMFLITQAGSSRRSRDEASPCHSHYGYPLLRMRFRKKTLAHCRIQSNDRMMIAVHRVHPYSLRPAKEDVAPRPLTRARREWRLSAQSRR